MIPTTVERQFSGALKARLVELRRAIHQNPELSFHETETAGRLTSALEELGVQDIRAVTKTGIVARVSGRNRMAPVVAVRGDIDALPIQEATGLDFASRVAG